MYDEPWEQFSPQEVELMKKAGARTLLITARLEGLKVVATDDGTDLRYTGSREQLIARWKPFLDARKAEALHDMLYGLCDRCGATGTRLVPAWWADPTRDQAGVVCEKCADEETRSLGIDRLAGG